MTAKVSVIVPVYNVEKYLTECMESIVGQTLRELEIICVNDGSTDGSLEILNSYAKKDDRVVVIDKPNGGYGHAMNTGLDRATGEYVGIVEPDDYIKLEMFEDLYTIAKEKDLDVIKADFHRFVHDEKGELQLKYYHLSKDAEAYNKVVNPYDHPEVFRYVLNTWSGIYKRAFLEEYHIRHNETPGASFQDNGFWFQTFAQAQRMYFVDKPYYMNRRDNPNSSVHSKEKVYCMNEEYAFIHAFMEAHPQILERFKYEYSLKRCINYMFSFRRVGEEFKLEYARRFAEEFREAERLGELDESIFKPEMWKNLRLVMEDPDGYYYYQKFEVEKLEKKIQKLEKKVKDIKQERSYKVGRMVTWLPRKIKGKKK